VSPADLTRLGFAGLVCDAHRVRNTTLALVIVATSLLAAPTSAIATSPAHHQTKCKNDGHKYISGVTATRHGKKAEFVGTFARFHPCGEDDGYFTGNKKTITLTLTPKTTIKVFKNELNPSKFRTVTAAHFPRAFKKNKDEFIYRYSGPRSGVQKLSEHFVS
jgi:hypothetical protein